VSSLTRLLLLGLFFLPNEMSAQAGRDSSLRRYAGTYVWDRLLAERPVRRELVQLLGPELSHLERNLFVSGSVDLIGGLLAISGNAAHQGGEEEAIVCIAENPVAVHVAILTGGRIKVYSRAKAYESVPICIMDWVTQANSEHRDRFQKPANVDLIPPRP